VAGSHWTRKRASSGCSSTYSTSSPALGGTVLLPGTLADPIQFRLINAAAVAILTIAALLPIAMLPLWRRQRARPVLLAVCWLVAVGCAMHALIDSIERVLSLAGLLRIEYPTMWASIDRRAADLQDLFFNEPWFLLEGLGFGAIGWIAWARVAGGDGGSAAPLPRPRC
jgi:hypothetical protein